MSAHGVDAMVGIDCCTDSPSDFSMYLSSCTSMVGWMRGFSNTSHSHSVYLHISIYSQFLGLRAIAASHHVIPHLPNESNRTVEVKRRLPTDGSQKSGHGKSDHDTSVRATEGDRRQTWPLQRWRPEAPYAMACRVCYTLLDNWFPL